MWRIVLWGFLLGGCAEPPAVLPPLLASVPQDGASAFSYSGWLRLEFADPVSDHASNSFELRCNELLQPIRIHRIATSQIAIDPRGELAPATRCNLNWRGASGVEQIAFSTAERGPAAEVFYDREDPKKIAPFPDDFWLLPNPAHPTDTAEQRLRIELSGFRFPDQWLMNALAKGVRDFDGFSPVAHITIPLSVAAHPGSLPHTPEESLDPLASVGLFDITPGDPDYATRVAFRLEERSERKGELAEHALLLFPSGSLKANHRYAVIVTRRVRSRAGTPFAPSPFFRVARDGKPEPTDSWAIKRVRTLVGETLAAVESSEPSIESADVAFAVRFTVRSLAEIADDLMVIRRKTVASRAPRIDIKRVVPESFVEIAKGSGVAAIVHGTWSAPEWRHRKEKMLLRDPDSGEPVRAGWRRIPFVLALPRAAFAGPVPVVMYQHGNPGSAREEVLRHARDSLAAAGFAVIGFTDVMNREVSPPGPNAIERARRQIVDGILINLLETGTIADYFIQTAAEQLAFIRAIGEVAAISSFPLGRPYGIKPLRIHGIDGDQPLLYLGVSEGANHGVMLLPFAPEIRAAVLISPGRRFSEVLIHQGSEQILAPLSFLGFGRLSPTEIWASLALIQGIFDRQDPHSFARFLYREPLEIDPPRRASILLVEGLGDSLVPNHATRALASELGPLSQLAEPGKGIPGFSTVQGPVVGNVDARTTAAFYQYVPKGVQGVESTPGCDAPPLSERSAREGHYCAQSAEESMRQRIAFFTTALEKQAPEIIDPLAK
jgi:hypothetical protein